MKIRLYQILLFLGFVIILVSCGDRKNKKLPEGVHQVKAEEVIQTTRYTYVRVSENDGEYWLAINKADIRKGETYYWSMGAEMNSFTSKELQRTFPSIYFVQDFSDQPILASQQEPPVPVEGMPGNKPSAPVSNIKVEKAPNGISIGELYTSKNNFAGKNTRIRGQVVKFLPGIMNRNFVHLQDGTLGGGEYDLTITTMDSVSVGEVVTFEGLITLDKDFGAGYKYNVIMENARILK